MKHANLTWEFGILLAETCTLKMLNLVWLNLGLQVRFFTLL